MKKLQYTLFFLAFGIFHLLSFSQTNNQSSQFTLSGTVLNEKNQAMEFANVVLLSNTDSTFQKGTISDIHGNFSFTNLNEGQYSVVVKHLGYEYSLVSGINLQKQIPDLIIDTIVLQKKEHELEGVNVIAERNFMEFKIDKKILNVSKDPNAAGGTVLDVLENTPSVKVDMEGNVSIRGSSGFQVLIDGKPTIMDGNDILKTTPADAVENIEIITNPSAKYDSGGDAGIINIILKKNHEEGITGLFNASVSTGNKYSIYTLLNYKTSRINYSLSLEHIHRRFINDGDIYRETRFKNSLTGLMDSLLYLQTTIDNTYSLNDYEVRFGTDIILSDKNTLSLQARYKDYPHTFHFISTYDEWTYESDHLITQSESELVVGGKPVRFAITDVHKFNNEGHQLELYGFAGKKLHTNTQFLESRHENTLFEKTNREMNNNQLNLTFKADYSLPIGEKSRFEAGFQFVGNMHAMEHLAIEFDLNSNTRVPNDDFSYKVDYSNHLSATYFTYADELSGFQYKFGLRGEYLNREIEVPHLNNQYIQNDITFYPSAFVSKKINEKQQMQLSYSRRVNRLNQLISSPIPFYSDNHTIIVGNPDLKPEYVNSFGLKYQQNIGEHMLAIEGYHRNINNSIFMQDEVDSLGIYYRIFQNISDENITGLELSTHIKITSWWEMDANADAFILNLDGEISDSIIFRTDQTWSASLNATFTFKSKTRFQLYSEYNGPHKTLQGETIHYFVTGISAKQEFLNRKLTVTIRIQDILKTAMYERSSVGHNFNSVTKYTPEAPIFTIHISYLINNHNNKRNDDNPGSGEGGFIF